MIQFRGATVESIRSRRRAASLRSKDLSTTPRRPTAPQHQDPFESAMHGFGLGAIIGLLLWLPIIVFAIWLAR